jgi:glutamate-ammonia-ligase adenylyltransferase
MALTRARPVFGSAEGRSALQSVIDGALRKPRDPVRLVADAVAMRTEMAARKAPRGRFDIKLGPGGLVDLEFAVHTLQLKHQIGLHPHLENALEALAAAGLVSDGIDPALRLLTRMLVMFRLVSPTSDEPPDQTKPLVAAACGMADWNALLAAHDSARQRVKELWSAVSQA